MEEHQAKLQESLEAVAGILTEIFETAYSVYRYKFLFNNPRTYTVVVRHGSFELEVREGNYIFSADVSLSTIPGESGHPEAMKLAWEVNSESEASEEDARELLAAFRKQGLQDVQEVIKALKAILSKLRKVARDYKYRSKHSCECEWRLYSWPLHY
jgi:hypothetical protein